MTWGHRKQITFLLQKLVVLNLQGWNKAKRKGLMSLSLDTSKIRELDVKGKSLAQMHLGFLPNSGPLTQFHTHANSVSCASGNVNEERLLIEPLI